MNFFGFRVFGQRTEVDAIVRNGGMPMCVISTSVEREMGVVMGLRSLYAIVPLALM